MLNIFFALFLIIISVVLLIIFAPIGIIFGVVRERSNLYMYFKKIAISIDQVGGTIMYGTEDWTISSYTHLMAKYGGHIEAIVFEKFVNALAYPFEKNHCWAAYERERLELKKQRGER
jgi:hypothetical protein